MFPKIDADLSVLATEIVQSGNIVPLGKSFVFDYKTGQHKVVDGKLVECTSDETIIQWIEKVLRTELEKYKIYTEDEEGGFGISIYKYIGEKNLPIGYISSELKREITEQMLQHRYINQVENYKTERERRGLKIDFSVRLINGKTLSKELCVDEL